MLAKLSLIGLFARKVLLYSRRTMSSGTECANTDIVARMHFCAPARARMSAIARVTTRHAVHFLRRNSAASGAASGSRGNASRSAASAAAVSA